MNYGNNADFIIKPIVFNIDVWLRVQLYIRLTDVSPTTKDNCCTVHAPPDNGGQKKLMVCKT